jgi:hypothetical protein
MADGRALVERDTLDLATLLVRTQVMGYHFVVVPDAMAREAGIPEGDHPSSWIPQLDGRRPACGEAQRLVNVSADLWCLKPEGHRGDHW